MIDRQKIADMISGILSARKSYKAVPRGMTEHIVACIEHPGGDKAVYRTGSLVDYARSRRMKVVLEIDDAGYRKEVEHYHDIHDSIHFCLDYYDISEGDLANDGIDYRYPKGSDVSFSIDKLCDILNRTGLKMTIIDNERG